MALFKNDSFVIDSFQKNELWACITRLEILRTKMQNFQNPHKDWRAAFLKVRTNGLAKL
jgi:hypothetical protein